MLHLTIHLEDSLQSVTKACRPEPARLIQEQASKQRYAKSPVNTSSGRVKGSCVTLPADCAMNSHHTAVFSGCRVQSSKVKLKLDEQGGPYPIGYSFPGFPTISLSPDLSSGGDATSLMPNHRGSSEKTRSQDRGPPSWALKASFTQVFPRAAYSVREFVNRASIPIVPGRRKRRLAPLSALGQWHRRRRVKRCSLTRETTPRWFLQAG